MSTPYAHQLCLQRVYEHTKGTLRMSHKAAKDLKPCKYCGGKPELRKERKIVRISHAGIERGQSFYIRCENCRARTQAFRDIPNAVCVWNIGNYYQHNT